MKKTDCPKVVIGVCTYNRCKDLRRLLQSLIKLDYPNFEIIVVDNNSTDQTAKIIFYRQTHHPANPESYS